VDVVVTSHATSKNATWREQWKQCMEKLIHSLIQFFRWTFDSQRKTQHQRRSHEDLNCSHEAFQVRTTSHLATWSIPRYHHFIIHTTQSTLGRNSFPTNKGLARACPTLPNKRLPTGRWVFNVASYMASEKKMKSNITRSRTYNGTFYIILYTF
jgi:hypothetical protein